MKIRPSTYIIAIAITLIMGISITTLYAQSMRLDEAQLIWDYSKSIPELLKITGQDVHVPLYSILLHFWMQLFGINIIAARSLSVLFFIATVPVLYLLAKESAYKKVAYMTILLFSLSPFILWYSYEATMYTLFLFATALNHLYFLRLYNSDGKVGKFGFFISTLMGFYTHYFFLFLTFSQIIFIGCKLFGLIQSAEDFNYKPTESTFFRYKKFTLVFLRLIFASVLLFLPWLYYVSTLGYAANMQPSIPVPTSFNILQSFVNFLFGFQNQDIQGVLISLWPLLILMILFLFTQRKQIRSNSIEYFIFVTFLPIILLFGASFIKPMYLSRYLILVTPTLFFIIAATLLSYTKRISYLLTGTLVAGMFVLLINQNVSASTPVKENYNGVARYLNTNAKPDEIISISSPFTIYPIEYYYSGQARIDTIPLWDRYAYGPIPPFTTAGLKNQIDADRQKYKYIYVVLSYDQGYEKAIIKYLDEHYQLVHVQKFSPGLQIRKYKLRYDIK